MHDTRDRIVDAAATLLRDEGPAALTTRRVAHDAGVQAPAIYRLFGDKDGLLEAVAEHVMAGYVAAKAAVVEHATSEGVEPLDDLRAGWDAQIAFGLANPTLFRLLSDPDRVRTSAAARSGRAVLEERVRRVAETGRLRVSEERAVAMISAAGVGAITTLLSVDPAARDEGLAGALLDAVLSRILRSEGFESPGEAIATAVALRAMAGRLDGLSAAERDLMGEWLDRAIEHAQA
ncbi:TetR family transcriptional regulator [Frondihabitans australicus]|uniref:TetR family transcriptional regulator n=2 Tax=Frondihabitans australicus TaxID=386892 RepID=A0A495IJR5_9MICO|nr:TetR family transcriptional regulator [Frondihabitans australicus]